jgi:hypothetical protein
LVTLLIGGVLIFFMISRQDAETADSSSFAPYESADVPVVEAEAEAATGQAVATAKAPSNPGVAEVEKFRPTPPDPTPLEHLAAMNVDADEARAADKYGGFEPLPPRVPPLTGFPENEEPPIPKEKIQQVLVDEYMPVVKRCYEDLLNEFPDAMPTGRVVVAFDIVAEDGEGRVALAERGDGTTLFEGEFHNCLLSNLGEVVFPTPDGEQKLRVNYPFHFFKKVPDHIKTSTRNNQ